LKQKGVEDLRHGSLKIKKRGYIEEDPEFLEYATPDPKISSSRNCHARVI
jgi:hypothetical protein